MGKGPAPRLIFFFFIKIRPPPIPPLFPSTPLSRSVFPRHDLRVDPAQRLHVYLPEPVGLLQTLCEDRKSTRLNSSHSQISYAVFCLKKKHPPAVALKDPQSRTTVANIWQRLNTLPT